MRHQTTRKALICNGNRAVRSCLHPDPIRPTMATRDVSATSGLGRKKRTFKKSSPLRPYKAPTLQSSGASHWLGLINSFPYAPTELSPLLHMRMCACGRMCDYVRMWRRGVVVYINTLKDIDKKPLRDTLLCPYVGPKIRRGGLSGGGLGSPKPLKPFEKGGFCDGAA